MEIQSRFHGTTARVKNTFIHWEDDAKTVDHPRSQTVPPPKSPTWSFQRQPQLVPGDMSPTQNSDGSSTRASQDRQEMLPSAARTLPSLEDVVAGMNASHGSPSSFAEPGDLLDIGAASSSSMSGSYPVGPLLFGRQLSAPASVPAPRTSVSMPVRSLLPQPQTLKHRCEGRSSGADLVQWIHHIDWVVDARKLGGNDKQVVSPPFKVHLAPSCPEATFKVLLYPKASHDARGGAAFKKSRGRGFLKLKCESDVVCAVEEQCLVQFSFAIGEEERGPVLHDFAKACLGGLQRSEELWDFGSVVDDESETFCVFLHVCVQASCASASRGVHVS